MFFNPNILFGIVISGWNSLLLFLLCLALCSVIFFNSGNRLIIATLKSSSRWWERGRHALYLPKVVSLFLRTSGLLPFIMFGTITAFRSGAWQRSWLSGICGFWGWESTLRAYLKVAEEKGLLSTPGFANLPPESSYRTRQQIKGWREECKNVFFVVIIQIFNSI